MALVHRSALVDRQATSTAHQAEICIHASETAHMGASKKHQHNSQPKRQNPSKKNYTHLCQIASEAGHQKLLLGATPQKVQLLTYPTMTVTFLLLSVI
jgi:hypothetical protein